jgi:hypothetical protein
LSLHSWRSERSRRQGCRRCHNDLCADILAAFLIKSLISARFIDETWWYKAKLTVSTLCYYWIIRISKVIDARLSELCFMCQNSLNVSAREGKSVIVPFLGGSRVYLTESGWNRAISNRMILVKFHFWNFNTHWAIHTD